ncbi:GntR family transcriptional regulator [Isoptericola sp. b408]|uniref:GntR family transcriptional regulator n=1 Tax=Isoptericola sp. b408 TaxID=3064653 RepID=UPI002712A3BB|nr:GntR family transcriptional regulator [Isoptericola sp. b408]MDO8152170.1 GntR family transcriptional regulator [Isoptericola sp. b408]
MPLRIALTGSAPPADQIRDQIRGLVTTGRLGAGERLPSVRQLSADLGVAAGTVAKAYRSLEADGVLASRIGSGTRVSTTAGAAPHAVVESAQGLARAGREAGVDVDEAVRVLRAVWGD